MAKTDTATDAQEVTLQDRYDAALRFITKLVLAGGGFIAKHEPEGERADLLKDAVLDGHAFLWADREGLKTALTKGHGPDCTCYENVCETLDFDNVDPNKLRHDLIQRRVREGIDKLIQESDGPEDFERKLAEMTAKLEAELGIEVQVQHEQVKTPQEAAAKLREFRQKRKDSGDPNPPERFREEKDEEGRTFIVDSKGTIVA